MRTLAKLGQAGGKQRMSSRDLEKLNSEGFECDQRYGWEKESLSGDLCFSFPVISSELEGSLRAPTQQSLRPRKLQDIYYSTR